jgi:hypothetical protein
MQRTAWRSVVVLGASVATLWPHTATAVLHVEPRARVPVVVRVDQGFHWLDAGIGALAALGLVLLVLGFALTAHRNLRQPAKGER